MSSIPWILISVLIVIIILAIFAIYMKGKYKRPTDYYAFFIIGLIWTIFGVFFYFSNKQFTFLVMGIVFLVIGLANKDKWKKNRVTWNKLSKEERLIRFWVMVVLGLLVLIGLIAFFLVEKGII